MGIFNEGLSKVLYNQLPLYLSATSHHFFFFIGSQNRFHLLIYTSWSYPWNPRACVTQAFRSNPLETSRWAKLSDTSSQNFLPPWWGFQSIVTLRCKRIFRATGYTSLCSTSILQPRANKISDNITTCQ